MVSMRKIYLSKSNRACPDHVMLVRRHLEHLGYEIIEHHGGEYDPDQLFNCQHMVMVGIEPPTPSREGIVKIGKGQYQQLQARMNNSRNTGSRNLYFSHTEGDDDLVPVYKQVVTRGVVDTENWTTGYGLLKVKMESHFKLSRIASHAEKAGVNDVDTTNYVSGKAFVKPIYHLACITLFK